MAPTFDVPFLFTIRVQFLHRSLVVIKQVPRISFGFKLFNKPPVYSIPQQIAKLDCKIYNNCCLRSLEHQSGFYSALLVTGRILKVSILSLPLGLEVNSHFLNFFLKTVFFLVSASTQNAFLKQLGML